MTTGIPSLADVVIILIIRKPISIVKWCPRIQRYRYCVFQVNSTFSSKTVLQIITFMLPAYHQSAGETLEFTALQLWPPNSPNLNLVDYSTWGALLEKLHQTCIADLNDLKHWLNITGSGPSWIMLSLLQSFVSGVVVVSWRASTPVVDTVHGSRFTIRVDACPLSCVSAEACLISWPSA